MSSNGYTEEKNDRSMEKKNWLSQKLESDGVVNPKGFALLGGNIGFIATVPLTSFLARPNGMLEKLVNALCAGIAFVGSAGSTSKVSSTGMIAALSALYIWMTFVFSGVGSAAGMNISTKDGRDDKHPRAQVAKLNGLPLRMHSAHSHMVENISGFVLAAALTQVMAPGDQTLTNLLGLHVICKVFV
ncbi:hypothetical protein LTR37_017367 [Vermiconidia calcicola]|uniref:Uncharacterized protein n=1 Tax=Vermiconidia calcicola TaxID=1690605 RepID=A0ACC3ML72_9PEZI|nr:hypothetical protein LTR37_017367 [Vermiconidia calcicola]